MRPVEPLINKIAGEYPVFNINERAARIVCFYTGFNFLVGTVVVLALHLTLNFLIFQLAATIIFFSLYYLLTLKKYERLIVYLVVALLCMAFSLFWFEAGGLNGPALVSVIVVFYCCFNIVKPAGKLFVIILVLFVAAVTLWLNWLFPHWVTPYPLTNQAFLHYFLLIVQFGGYFILIEASSLYCYNYEQLLVNSKNEELAKANEAKLRLFAIISHDLRGPMATLKAILNSVEEGFSTPEKTQRQLAHLKTMMTPLNNSLNNLLLWSRMQLEGLSASPEWFTTGDILQEELQIAAEQANLAGVTLSNRITSDTRLYADVNHCRIIFRNLIANAIHHARKGTVVALLQQPANGKMIFMITNEGTRIPETAAAEFNQTGNLPLNPTTSKRSGLGLQLCSDFVKINGGKIWIDTTQQAKTVFCFSLNTEA